MAFQKWKENTQKLKLWEARWKLDKSTQKIKEIDHQNIKYKWIHYLCY